MIYLDTSVLLAQLLAEDRFPPEELWREELVSSRLLEFETWNRLNARGLAASHGRSARLLLGRVTLLEMIPSILSRALEPFPISVRTLDGLHLATIEFIRSQDQQVTVATYDQRLQAAAAVLGIPLDPRLK